MLTQSDPTSARRTLLQLAQQDVTERWRRYQQLAASPSRRQIGQRRGRRANVLTLTGVT